MVRMTDRKPKWAVSKEQEEKTKTAQSVPEEAPQATPPLPPSEVPKMATPPDTSAAPPAFDFDSIRRRRGYYGRTGKDCRLLFMVGPSALIPLENTCADIHEGNYDFHICPFRYIAQMENWDGGFRGIIG